ncbi:MAG TPA: hypothetical protein VL856_14075 [Acidimicrobiia bacterium]|jgi:Domain of unknown function DUF11|nr:hypothetical protein [Acidimicrobiia bacterium]
MALRRSRGAHKRALAVTFLLGVALLTLGAFGIEPAFATQSITTAGPLTNVSITGDLNCAVNHTGDTSGEFFDDTACATEIAIGTDVYGPDTIPAGNTPIAFTPVSQSAVTGSGTAGDPFKIVTVVDVGNTGLHITETDTYVVGQESYRTDVQVSNTTGAVVNAQLYRGGDCFLQDSDTGFGAIGNPAGAVACVAEDLNNPGNPGTRIEQWLPLSAGSHYYEATYSDVWDAMSSGNAFPDTCDCATNEDNGAGLSWAISVPANGSVTRSHLTTFSPAGNLPLTTAKTADASTVAQGGQDGYTITISNPNNSSVSLTTIADTLPGGFAYVPGSSTGATTTDPAIAASTLTWNGPFNVPAATGQTPGTLSLHFNVTANASPGTYTNTAGGTSASFTVVSATDTAPVTVTETPPTSTSTSSTSTSTSVVPTSTSTSTSVASTSTSTSTSMAPTTTSTSTSTSTSTTTVAPTSTTTTVPASTTTMMPTTTTTTRATTTTTTTTTTSTSTTTTTQPPTTSTTVAALCKPGYGYGDQNHCHSGPPGASHGSPHMRFIDVATSNSARWTIIAAGLLCLGFALLLQRRLRRL